MFDARWLCTGVLVVGASLGSLSCAPVVPVESATATLEAPQWDGSEIVLTALRVRSPAYWEDGVATSGSPVDFVIPGRIPVMLGSSGDQRVDLRFRNPAGQEIKCEYRGDGVKAPKPEDLPQTPFFFHEQCGDNVKVGDTVQVTWVSLHIRDAGSWDAPDMTKVELRLGGTLPELEAPISAQETAAIRGSFAWWMTSPLPETNTEGAPALFYTIVYVEEPEHLYWLDELQVHYSPLPLFAEEHARWEGQRGMFSHEGDGHGTFVFALMPAATYNLLREAALEDPELVAYEVISLRDVPAEARLPDGSVSYAALRNAGFMYRDLQPDDPVTSKPGDFSRQGFLKKLRDRLRNIATAVTTVVRTVVQVIGVIDRTIRGSVNLQVRLDLFNTDPRFNQTLRMQRPWGSGAGQPVMLPGVRVDVYQFDPLFLLPTLFTDKTNGQSTASKRVMKGVRASLCVRVENDAAYVTKLLLGVQVCDFNSIPASSLQHDLSLQVPVRHGYFNILAQATEGRAYLSNVAGHHPRQASILVGRLANLVGDYVNDVAIAPCLGFTNLTYDAIVLTIADTAFSTCMAVLGSNPVTAPAAATVCPALHAAIVLGGSLYAVDIIVPEATENLESRGVLTHEYGHFAFCSMLQEANPLNLTFMTPALIAQRMTRDPQPNAETAYINEAFADFFAGQVVGGKNYAYDLRGQSDWFTGLNYCSGLPFTAPCFDDNLRGTATFDDQVGRTATLLHDAFDGLPSNPFADVPGNAGYWDWTSGRVLHSPVHGGDFNDEEIELPGSALQSLASNTGVWLQGLTQDSFFSALSDTAEQHGYSWCQRCLLFARHDARFVPPMTAQALCQEAPIRDWIGSGTSSNTVTFQPGPEGKDALIWSRSDTRDLNQGNGNFLDALAWTWSGDPGVMRSLLQFDLSSIPPGTNILDARLDLFANTNGAPDGHSDLTGSNAWFLERITGPWAENAVTWNNQPPTDPSQRVLLPRSTSRDQTYTVDVRAMVQAMINSPASNHGFMIRLQTESHYRAIRFASSDISTQSLRPRLRITLEGC